MADWKIFADTIEIFPHPNADKMELGRVGSFQVVVGKGLYKTGDLVVFAPKRSILPPDLRGYFTNEETGKSYLRGPNEDRVGSIRLRGEESEGAILPREWWEPRLKLAEGSLLGTDLSSYLGIQEYIPELHSVGSRKRKWNDGDIVQRVDEAVKLDRFVRHDVEQFRIFEKEFVPGEVVTVTEKLHGTQINIIKDKFNRITVTSKGRAEKNLVLRQYPKTSLWKGASFLKKLKRLLRIIFYGQENPMNEYWQYAEDSGILKFLTDTIFDGVEVQIIGEVVPAQQGYSYGLSNPQVFVFRVVLATKEQQYGTFDGPLTWVPLLYYGPYDLEKIKPLADGKETVSGKDLHIREGVVLQPAIFRKATNGTPLIVKFINPKYKETNDDLR